MTDVQLTACVFRSNYAFHLTSEGLTVCPSFLRRFLVLSPYQVASDPCSRLITIHQRYRQTDRTTVLQHRDGEPFYKRSPQNYKHWDSAYIRQGTSYQCRDISPAIWRIGRQQKYFNLRKRIYLNKRCLLTLSSSILVRHLANQYA